MSSSSTLLLRAPRAPARAGEVFNISLHVPTLRVEEVVRVLRSLDVFNLADIPDAVEVLTTHSGKTVPIKKLLLWIELAKQVRACAWWSAAALPARAWAHGGARAAGRLAGAAAQDLDKGRKISLDRWQETLRDLS